ncbi:MAG TPA: DUF4140 domain-containing protein, partial [Synergistales bacterium]|nr:DUF4140 domain-containing protein [Synergistales bacterium]
MKRYAFLAATAVLFVALIFQGAASGAGPARMVDVYPRGALVRITLPAEPEISIELPSTFDPASIAVAGEGNVKVTGFDVREVVRTGWVPPSLSPLAEEVEKAQAQVDMLASKASSIAQAIRHVEEAVPTGLKSTELDAYVDTAQKKREALELRASETGVLLERARKEHAALKAEYDSRFPGQPDRILLVSAATEGKGEVT